MALLRTTVAQIGKAVSRSFLVIPIVRKVRTVEEVRRYILGICVDTEA